MNLTTLNITANSDDFNDDVSTTKYKTSIYDINCKNEIQISNVIKNEIPNPSNYDIIHQYEFLNVKDINQRTAMDDNHHFVLLRYNLDTLKYQTLDVFLSTVNLPARFLSNMLKIYSNLLNCLQELEKIDICFFDFSAENILVDSDCNVILTDFKHSLHFNYNFEYFLEKSIENLTHYTFKPIEIHLIHYLTKVNNNPLSYSSIDEITTYYVENMEFLKHFDKDSNTNYYHECVAYLKKQYLHKSKEDIFNLIRENWKTWDNFALSVFFLHLLETANQCFSLDKTIISEIILVLKQNVNASPTKRSSISATKNAVDTLFRRNSNWDFLHLIPKCKMKKLYKLL